MIRFSCEHCGYKVAVEDAHANKRGKCPACGTVITVPAESTLIEFDCRECGRRLTTPKSHAGRKVVCPGCRKVIYVPASASEETPATSTSVVHFTCSTCNWPFDEPESSQGKLIECPHCHNYTAVPLAQISAQEVTIPLEPMPPDKSEEQFEQMQTNLGGALQKSESLAERKLPWILDIFLYPTSKPGLTILGIAVIVRVTFRIVVRFLGSASIQFLPFLAFFGFMWAVGMIARIVICLYVWWYLCECIRESTAGVIRAPEITGRSPGLGGMLWQALMTAGCFLLYLGPAIFYYKETNLADAVFWAFAVYAVFFLPMSLLAVVVFESWQGLNPILLVRSIIRTFLPYCALTAAIAALAATGVFIVRKMPDPQKSSLGLFVLWSMSIYLAMIVAHLLGAFCCRYKEKLNWEV